MGYVIQRTELYITDDNTVHPVARPLKNVNFCSSSRKTKNLITGIHCVFRGLNFESDAEIGQKGAFFKGINVGCSYHSLFRYSKTK